MSQAHRVLEALRLRPQTGLTQVDFLAPHVCDGGAPITRVAARIEELRDDGYRIASGERRQSCVVYRLTGEPAEEAVGGVEGGQTEAPLTPLFPIEFDEICPPPRPRRAIYD